MTLTGMMTEIVMNAARVVPHLHRQCSLSSMIHIIHPPSTNRFFCSKDGNPMKTRYILLLVLTTLLAWPLLYAQNGKYFQVGTSMDRSNRYLPLGKDGGEYDICSSGMGSATDLRRHPNLSGFDLYPSLGREETQIGFFPLEYLGHSNGTDFILADTDRNSRTKNTNGEMFCKAGFHSTKGTHALEKTVIMATPLSIHPHPTSGRIWVEVDLNGTVQIQLHNAGGDEVLTQSIPAWTGSYPLDIYSLPAGIYQMEVRSARQRQFATIVLAHQ
jgi:hypothetical protein